MIWTIIRDNSKYGSFFKMHSSFTENEQTFFKQVSVHHVNILCSIFLMAQRITDFSHVFQETRMHFEKQHLLSIIKYRWAYHIWTIHKSKRCKKSFNTDNRCSCKFVNIFFAPVFSQKEAQAYCPRTFTYFLWLHFINL